MNNRGDAEIIVIGNSKALSSVSSVELYQQFNRKTYNLAYRIANLNFTENILKSYIKSSLRKPTICILEMSWFSFSNSRTSYPHDKPQLDLKNKDYTQLFTSMTKNRADIIKKATIVLFNIKGEKYIDWWDGDPNKAPTVFDVKQFRIDEMKKVFPELESGIDKSLLQSFYEIISICKKNNIKLVLYTAPEAPIFTSFQKDKNIIKKIIVDSATLNNLEYYDFTVDGVFYNKELDSMLYDSQHIRKSIEFTKYFASILLKYNSISAVKPNDIR
jgi:hypothetical protein